MAATTTTHRRVGSSTGYRGRRRLVIAGVLLAIAGGIAALVVLIPDRDPTPPVFHEGAPKVERTPRTVPFPDEARQVAMRFVQTAVARENLAEAWTLSGPLIRGGLTRAEWMTGNNPVVPYPIDKLEVAPFKVDYSYADSALIELALIPKKGSGVRAQVFFMRLDLVGAPNDPHWVVNNWVPRAAAVTPR